MRSFGVIFCLAFLPLSVTFAEEAPPLPQFSLNGKVEVPTVQELSGLTTRPLRLLVQRNNKKHQDALMQPYALGVRTGDELLIKMASPRAGERVTLYKIFREPQGTRYLSMLVSLYHGEIGEPTYREKVSSFREQFFIVVYEQTHSPDVKNAHIRYFEERMRKLVIASFRTNLLLSSLKFKMKDFAEDDARGFFTENAQTLIDKLIQPKRIYMLRLWAYDSDGENSSSIIPIEKNNE